MKPQLAFKELFRSPGESERITGQHEHIKVLPLFNQGIDHSQGM